MPGAVPDVMQSTVNLRSSLEDTAAALADADLEQLLTCEARIHAALTHITRTELSAESRTRLVEEIERMRLALTRCRRLGSALSDFVRIGLTAQGLDAGYGRTGGAGADLRTICRSA